MGVIDLRMNPIEFHRYVLALLKRLAFEEKTELYVENDLKDSKKTIVDAYAPMGLNGIEGPLAIEIKYNTNTLNTLEKNLLDLQLRLPEVKNILLILGNNYSHITGNEIHSITKLGTTSNIIIWNSSKIEEISKEFPDVAVMHYKYYNDKIASDALNTFQNNEYREKNNEYIKNLSNAYKRDELCLFLGAGVSVGETKLPTELENTKEQDSSLPDWNTLIKKLITLFFKDNYKSKFLPKELNSFFTEKNFNDFSPLILGRFIKHTLETQFYSKLRQALYEGYKKQIRPNSSVYSISKLCVPPREKKGISAVVTYNYDDLLEFYLDHLSVEYKTIYSANECSNNEELPIYHVHGYLPHNDEITNTMEESIVFSEHEYHHQYENSFSWQNVTQLGILREKTALFIGLSMNDPNIRRLLEVANTYSNYPKHYAILRDEWANGKDKRLGNIFRNMHAKSFEALGINIIWIKDYSEINDIVGKIKTSELVRTN
ncbi:SIR2 family protein [Fictibacillus halophilus]|uniref:SIR2 family protein n=1 Tax=Fictibacillus halophilus TaxID=1610490 RepID=UPI001CFA4E99|nr:SIR2 family protein [Fictibacillus halophilus]